MSRSHYFNIDVVQDCVYVRLLVTFMKQAVLWKLCEDTKMHKLLYTVLNITLICTKMFCCNLSCYKVWKRYVVWNPKYAFNLLLPKYILPLWAAVCLCFFLCSFFVKNPCFCSHSLFKKHTRWLGIEIFT